MVAMKYKRDFYVCFREAKGNYWWKIFTGKKRSHIFLITPCSNGSCAIIETSSGGTVIHTIDVPALDMANEAFKKGCDVLKYSVEKEDMDKPYFKLFRTCVTSAKDFLGIREFFIITPGQLFNELKGG